MGQIELLVAIMFLAVGMGHAKKKKIEKRQQEAFGYKPEPILGDAQFATDKQLRAAGLFSKTGINCGHSESGRTLRWDGERGAITVAPMGEGKNAVQINPALMGGLDKETVFVFSVKGDTAAVTSRYRSSLGPVYQHLPCGGFLPGMHGRVTHHSVMSTLLGANQPGPYFNQDARSIAEGLIFKEAAGTDGAFFSHAAINVTHAVIMAVALHEPPNKRNLRRVYQLFASPNELSAWMKRIALNTPHEFLKDALTMFAGGSIEDRTFSGIIQTAQQSLDFLKDPSTVEYMSASDCDYAKSQDRVETHYYTVPVGRQELGARVLYLEITSLLNQLLRPGRRNTRVTIIFDDFGNYGAPPSVERALTAARGFGVRLWCIVQDLQVLSDKYPKTWQSWLTAAGCRVFMGAQDEQTAEFISKQCGVASVSQWQKSMGKEVEGEFELGWSRPLVSRPLVHPHEVRACPKDRMYLFAAGLPNVAFVKRIPYFKRWEYSGKYTPDPYQKRKGFFS